MSEITLRLPHPSRLPRTSLSPVGPARDAAYLIAGLPLGIGAFTVAVTGLSLAGGLAITLLGLPLLIGTLWLGRWFGWLERVRAAWLLRLPVPPRPVRSWRGGVIDKLKTGVGDSAGWRGTLWSFLLLPLGIVGFTVAVTLWATALGLIASPAWYWALEDGDRSGLFASASVGWTLARVAIGVLLVPVSVWVCRLLARGNAHAALAVTDAR